MSPTSHEPLSVLTIDLGTIHTRAFLFDVVEDSYHLIASGITQSTYDAPLSDIHIGILSTIDQLQRITGRVLLNQKKSLIIPSQAGSEGVDRLFVTHSFGPFVKIATYGLASDVSLKSINKLAATTYGSVVQSIGINDKRTANELIDDVIHSEPNLILFAGGADKGSSRAVKKMANLIAATLQLIPQDMRPLVVFSGNQLMVKPIKDLLGQYTKVESTVNIHPNMMEENLTAVSNELADIFTSLRADQYEGIKKISPLCSDSPCPSATAFGRIVQFLSEIGDPEKGVMAVDIGSGSTTIASARSGNLDLNVFPMGTGYTFKKFLENTPYDEISCWIPPQIQPEEARNQLWQKTLFPQNIPETKESLMIEQAAIKQLLHSLITDLAARNLLVINGYDTILFSGSTLTHMGSPAQLLMMLLDGLQPTGISTFVLDKYSILASLGAAARVIPLMAVQLLESAAFTNLATIVSIKSNARPGTVVFRGRLTIQGEQPKPFTVTQGELVSIPLPPGMKALLEVETTRQAQVETNSLADEKYRVNGGLCGLVIDARGRPLKLPEDAVKRGQLLAGWNESMGLK